MRTIQRAPRWHAFAGGMPAVRGQGVTEFALVLPLFMVAVLFALDFGRAFVGWVSLQQSARIGANFASVNATAWDPGGSTQTQQKYQDLLHNDAAGINCDFPAPVADPQFPSGKAVGAPAVVAIACPFHLITPLIERMLPAPFTLWAKATFPIRTGGLIPAPTGSPNPTPVPSFTTIPSPPTGTVPLTVQFTDTSSNSPTAWHWTLGDGSVRTVKTFSYTYTVVGNYSVTLCAYNLNGPPSPCASPATVTVVVQAAAPTPTASFTYFPASGVAPLFVQFTDTSTNSPTSWAWNFGDGQTSTLKNPTHQYNSSGNYTVTLTAYNAAGPSVPPASHVVAVTPPNCLVPNFLGDNVVSTSSSQPRAAIVTKWQSAGLTNQIFSYNGTWPTSGTHTVQQVKVGPTTYPAQTPTAGTSYPYNQCGTPMLTLAWK
jgi:PKD repeat protein